MRHLVIAAATLLSSAIMFAACSDDPVTGGTVPATDAGGTSSSGSTSSSSGASSSSSGSVDTSCIGLAQAGTSIDVKATKPPEPEATGGTPVDGTFLLKTVKAFTEIFPEGNTIQTFGSYTLVLSGGGKTFEQVVTNKDNIVTHAKGALVIDGINFTATPTCEQPMPDAGFTILKGKYTSDATTLKLYVVRDFGVTAELFFEKQ